MNTDNTQPLTVLLDDARDFKDNRPAHVVRTSGDALALLISLDDRPIDDLWLDYDLTATDLRRALEGGIPGTAKLRGEHVGSGRVASGHRPNSLSRLSTKDA